MLEYFREPVYVHEYTSRNPSLNTYIRIDMETYEDARHDPTETVTYLKRNKRWRISLRPVRCYR